MAYIKECVLQDRECISCGECDICDLNPGKICDNCCACIENGVDYKSVEIDEIIEDDSIEPDLEGWKYDEDYIVDYSEDKTEKTNPKVKRIRKSDN
jgi:hypothetical protein